MPTAKKPVKKVVKAKKSPVPVKKAKKKVKKPPVLRQCGICYTPRIPIRKMVETETGKKVCQECAEKLAEAEPAPKVTKKEVKAEQTAKLRWYVLAVEPGSEGRVKKDILRKVKIESMEPLVKKLLIPKKFEEAVLPIKGEVVHEERASDPKTANIRAQKKCKQLSWENLPDEDSEDDVRGPDGASATPGYRYTVFRSRGMEKGKEGNDWTWQVKTVPPGKVRKVIQVKKYPGYVICQLAFTPEVEKLVSKVRGQWGFLLRPVGPRFRLTVKQSKATGMWRWYIRRTDGNNLVRKGRAYQEKGKAQHVGEAEFAQVAQFRPSAMKTREAAELLIAQKAVNQIAKDKPERDKAVYSYRVGSTVLCIDGIFKNCSGDVLKIDKSDKTNPLVTIRCTLLGQELQVSVPHYELKLVKY